MAIVYRLIRDESGQDLVEYGFLAAFIGIVSIAVFADLIDLLQTAYSIWDTGVQNLWTCDPGACGPP